MTAKLQSQRSKAYYYVVAFANNIDYANYIGKQKSWYTIMVYLNENFDGGDTIFLDSKLQGTEAAKKPVYTLVPKPGMAIVFLQEDDSLLHEGAKLDSGFKYMIRSDVMYLKEKELLAQDKESTV
eukprot:Phypoly_transcript_18498.p2 GENE.Phypoly_transcript_18498~~Phypoly_transcript_18498.p2  ORF type:complete len:125 (+),score=23.72 Phypoly_transcript_18498:341-715(+)